MLGSCGVGAAEEKGKVCQDCCIGKSIESTTQFLQVKKGAETAAAEAKANLQACLEPVWTDWLEVSDNGKPTRKAQAMGADKAAFCVQTLQDCTCKERHWNMSFM